MNPLSDAGIKTNAQHIVEDRVGCVKEKDHRAAWLLKAITCIDLTTLAGEYLHQVKS